MENKYNNAIKILTSQEKFHICLGLERIAQILELLGNPQDKLKIIHIAGTNGKGSTSAILSAVLSEAGYKTGLYTSPHILEYTERIKINNHDISQEDFSNLVIETCDLAKKNDIYLTEFEVLTAVAFKYFAQKKIDICVLETGLGGRFDATNVIKDNLLSVLTSISFDHTDRLGDTVEKIAYEKAGIIKSNRPVIVSKNNAGYETIKECASEKNSKILTISPSSSVEIKFENGINYVLFSENNKKYEFNLLGLYQKENLELALEVLNNLKEFPVKEEVLKKALKKVSWPCRLQYDKEKNLIIDGAHNPDGAKVLKESLDYYFPDEKRIWIYGTLKNKDYKTVLKTLLNDGDTIYLYDFKHQNHANYKEISDCLSPGVLCKKAPEIAEIIESDGLKIIAGSIYMIGEILIKP